MTHLDNHPHAFIDSNNLVIGVYLFDEHNAELLEKMKTHLSAVEVLSCCEFGIASNGSEFYNGKFYGIKPYPEWVRNEELGQWVAPEDWVQPIE